MDLREEYLKVYNKRQRKGEGHIPKPEKEFTDTDSYVEYLQKLRQYYKQLIPMWEVHVGNRDENNTMAYILLYDPENDNFHVHWWSPDNDHDNQISDLNCNHINPPKALGIKEEQDAFNWLIGLLLQSKYIAGNPQPNDILKVVRCSDNTTFYIKE